MRYLPLDEILSVLDRQQREELADAASRIPEHRLLAKREARKALASVSAILIERSWQELGPRIAEFRLEAETGMPTEELRSYLDSLKQRQTAFAWGWTRSRMNARLMAWIEEIVPQILAEDKEFARRYERCLRRVDHYWFRTSALHHMKAGYHTALSVACKWYGSAFELVNTQPEDEREIPHFSEELRQFASFSMTMLARTDGYLWDSAGAEPLDTALDSNRIVVHCKAIDGLDLTSAPDFGVRLGCPAMRARTEEGAQPFAGIIEWVETVFTEHLF